MKIPAERYSWFGFRNNGAQGDAPTTAKIREAKLADILDAPAKALLSLVMGKGQVVHINGLVTDVANLINYEDGSRDEEAYAFLKLLEQRKKDAPRSS